MIQEHFFQLFLSSIHYILCTWCPCAIFVQCLHVDDCTVSVQQYRTLYIVSIYISWEGKIRTNAGIVNRLESDLVDPETGLTRLIMSEVDLKIDVEINQDQETNLKTVTEKVNQVVDLVGDNTRKRDQIKTFHVHLLRKNGLPTKSTEDGEISDTSSHDNHDQNNNKSIHYSFGNISYIDSDKQFPSEK